MESFVQVRHEAEVMERQTLCI